LAFPARLGPDPAPVKLDQLLRQGEAEAGPLLLLGPGRLELDELPEETRKVLGLDPDAGVGNTDFQKFREG